MDFEPGGLLLGKARVGLADTQPVHTALACAATRSLGTLEIPGRLHFLDLSFQSLENAVNHRHLFNSDLTQSCEDMDRTHLQRTGLLLGFASFLAAKLVAPQS